MLYAQNSIFLVLDSTRGSTTHLRARFSIRSPAQRSIAAASRLNPSPAASARRSTSIRPTRSSRGCACFSRRSRAGDHLVCYAVKANSALAILKLLAEHGAGFDIVSGGELERVLAAAPEAAGRVVFSGVGKTAAEIDLALKAGILQFNVESEAELKLLAARARKLKIRARFALRVNPDVFADTHPYISTGLREHKFGIDIRHALRIYKSAANDRWLEAHGVSVHIGSQIRSAEPVRRGHRARQQAGAAAQPRRHRAQAIDAGGGLGIDYHAGAFDASRPKWQDTPRHCEHALGRLRRPPAHRAGPFSCRPGRSAAGARALRQAQRQKDLRDYRRGHERSHPPRALPGLSRDCARAAAGQGSRASSMLSARSASRAIFLPATASSRPSNPAIWWPCSMPAPTAWRKAPTTTPARAPAEVLVEGNKARLIRRRETMADLLAPEVV